MVLVYHSLGHGGRGEGKLVAVDEGAQERSGFPSAWSWSPGRRRAAWRFEARIRVCRTRSRARDGGASPAGIGGISSVAGASDTSSGRSRWTGPCGSLKARPIASSSTEATRPFRSGWLALDDGPVEGVVVDVHLDSSPQLVRMQVAGEGDERGAVQIGVAYAGREVGGPGAQGGDAEARRAREAAHHVCGEARRALVCGQDEGEPPLAHGFEHGQDVAARDAEAVRDARFLHGLYD